MDHASDYNMKENLPLISILMPTYNVSPWVLDSINSILSQTYVNFELIIVDDCSTDNTYDILVNISKGDSRIVLLQNEKNLKICKTLNKALSYAKGKLIARIDGDDIATPERLQKQFDFMNQYNLDLVGCQMIAITEDSKEIGRSKLPLGVKKIKKLKKLASPITHIWLAKREVYDELCGYRNIPYAEDYDFVLRALDTGFLCDNHPDYLMYIRHRSGNTSSVAGLAQRKTHNYVLALCKERERKGIDSFSELALREKTKSSKWLQILHKASNHSLNKAFTTNSFLGKVFFTSLSMLTSFYNAEYIIRRIIYRIKL